MTRVFVVTPAFNAAETIDRTITSVVTQEGEFDLHYHVQDGGSDDGTKAILKAWSGRLAKGHIPIACRSVRFTYQSAGDDGMYDAIVRGFAQMEMSPDDWMGWINADDILFQGTLALLARVDQTPEERHIKWIVGGAGVINHGTPIYVAPRKQASAIVRAGLADGRHWQHIQQEGTFFRRVLWNRIDVEADFRSLKYAGDWNLWRRFADKHLLYQLDRPLGGFRIRPGQISAQHRALYEGEIDKLVTPGARLQAFRQLCKEPPARRLLSMSYPDGALSSRQECLGADVAAWQTRLVGPTYDSDWQFPAVTEQHAYRLTQDSSPLSADTSYVAFPWASLIDYLGNRSPKAQPLAAQLDRLSQSGPPSGPRITVCQHVRMLEHRPLFEKLGITDIFWSHATKGMRVWPGKTPIRLHPFPLYPVQVVDQAEFSDEEERELLFNFAGAAENSWYLSSTRAWIIEHLRDDSRGRVISRNGWHYDRIVYEHQIANTAATPDGLVDENASREFRDLLRRSTFTLCPSGSGPNSIRLWEAIGAGSIPVILSDLLALPGPEKLWKEAAVILPETEETVADLGDLLEQLAADKEGLARRRRALRQLWMLYGPDNFIHDIRRHLYSVSGIAAPQPEATPESADARLKVALFGRHRNRTPLSYPRYRAIFRRDVDLVSQPSQADIAVCGFDIDIKENAEAVAQWLDANPSLKIAVLSEEPLWDTTWAKEHRHRSYQIDAVGRSFHVHVINHWTSDVFACGRLPYFITTDDEYAARYMQLLDRWSQQSVEETVARWEAARRRYVFLAEHRAEPQYSDPIEDAGEVTRLSGYRTRLAELMRPRGAEVAGKGWEGDDRRQDLADWHLDKLSRYAGDVFVMSALENTHHPQYVTEKFFDAFACGAMPAYLAAPGHSAHQLAPAGSFINLFGQSEEQAAARLTDLRPTPAMAEAWLEGCKALLAHFADSRVVNLTRRDVASRVMEALQHVAAGEWGEPSAVPVRELRPDSASQHSVAKGVHGAAPLPAEPPPSKFAHSSDGRDCFERAAVVEEVRQRGYRHLNVEVTNWETGPYRAQRFYFKVMVMKRGDVGLSFEADEYFEQDGSAPPPWTSEEGAPLSQVAVFASPFSLSWSETPDSSTISFILNVVAATPRILEMVDCPSSGDFHSAFVGSAFGASTAA